MAIRLDRLRDTPYYASDMLFDTLGRIRYDSDVPVSENDVALFLLELIQDGILNHRRGSMLTHKDKLIMDTFESKFNISENDHYR